MNTPLANEVCDPKFCEVGDWVRLSAVPAWQVRDGIKALSVNGEFNRVAQYRFALVEVQAGRSRIRGWKRIE